MEATAFTDQCNQTEKACKNGESIYKIDILFDGKHSVNDAIWVKKIDTLLN